MTVPQTPVDTGGLGEAITDIGKLFDRLEKEHEARAASDFVARAMSSAAIGASEISKRLVEPKLVESEVDMDETSEDFTPPTFQLPTPTQLRSGLESELGALRARILRNAPNELAAQIVGNRFEALRARTLIGAGSAYVKSSNAVRGQNLEAVFGRLGVQAFRNPDDLDSILGQGDDALSDAIANGYDGVGRRSVEFRRDVTAAAVRGLIARDPDEALERLKAGEFDQRIGEPDLLQRLQREAQIRIDRQDREFNAELSKKVGDAVFVLGAGKVPPGLDVLRELVKGSDLAAGLESAVEDRVHVEAFTKLPLREQAKVLAQDDETATKREVVLKGRLARAHAALRKAIKGGQGLAAAADIGVIEPVQPVDPANPESIARRAAQATVASQHFGVPVSPFLPGEEDAITETLEKASPDQATAMLASLHTGLGKEHAGALVDQLADKSPELAMALVNVADRPALSREIINGGRLLRQNKDIAPTKIDRVPAIESVLGGVFTPDTAVAMRPIADAAAALYVARTIATGDFAFDDDRYEQALQDVTGGIVEFNGRKIISPVPGMSEDAVEDQMEKLTQPDLIVHGNGVPVFADGTGFTVGMFESRFFGAEAQLVSSGFGTYLVFFPGLGYVQTTAGAPYELNLRAFIDGQR